MSKKEDRVNRKLRMVDLLEESPGIGRAVARRLAEKVRPGDVLDFEGWRLESNYFAEGKNKFIRRIIAYVDGCSKGNPGPAAIGIVIVNGDNEDEVLKKHARHLEGSHTNQSAEYWAVLEALTIAPSICTRKIEIRSDSQLVIRQMNREFRIKKSHLLDLHEKIRAKELTFEKVTYTQVSREHPWIREADRLANTEIRRVLEGKK